MADSPLVSIIIPCYNAEKYISESIQSVLSQSYSNCQIIVIDDGSTDSSLEKIKSFKGKIDWISGPNKGGCFARNLGLKRACGDWIQFLDADDKISKKKIESQMRILIQKSKMSVAVCPWRHFDKEGEFEEKKRVFWRSYDSGLSLLIDLWLDGGFYSPACWLISREMVSRVGYWNLDLSADQDGEYFGRVLLEATSVDFVSGGHAFYRVPGPNNVSRIITSDTLNSRFSAWKILSRSMVKYSDDRSSLLNRAILRKLRSLTYGGLCRDEQLFEESLKYEKLYKMLDFDPSMPVFSRVCIGALGLKKGICIRRKLRNLLSKFYPIV